MATVTMTLDGRKVSADSRETILAQCRAQGISIPTLCDDPQLKPHVIQGYLALIARGAYSEAVELIEERLPLPAVIGRICPPPCERACWRVPTSFGWLPWASRWSWERRSW